MSKKKSVFKEEDEIYDTIRGDIEKYTKAGIDLSKFPTLNKVVKNQQSALMKQTLLPLTKITDPGETSPLFKRAMDYLLNQSECFGRSTFHRGPLAGVTPTVNSQN